MTTTQAEPRAHTAPVGYAVVGPEADEPPPSRPASRWPASRWHRPSTARTRIIGWMLLLVLAALGVLTLVTWRLLVQETNDRMDQALVNEVDEFREVVSGSNPRNDQPFRTIREVLDAAIAYNTARPNEKFLGYIDGVYALQSRRADNTPAVLQDNREFEEAVRTGPPGVVSSFESAVGEVLYLAVPIEFPDPEGRTGVIVAAYLADVERRPAHDTARVMLAIGALTSLGAAAGAWLVAGRILRPLRDVAETARSITDTDLSRRIPLSHDPDHDHDELRDLVRTVNAMLDRVETGVRAQRRFVDDAGHELRTPITIVRGHLEVLDPADPADVASTVELVDDELGRMNRMVSDLLLLAKSEQPTFLQTELTDVTELTREVFDKVRSLGERDWILETTANAQAEIDPQRITQAVVALADNAVRHTRPGDRVALGSQWAGGTLRFWVADSGPGVSEADRTRIFERFSRGRSAGPRSDGAGLGLAITRAIAVAHGGQVLLDSAPGHGATFTVVVPAIIPEELHP